MVTWQSDDFVPDNYTIIAIFLYYVSYKLLVRRVNEQMSNEQDEFRSLIRFKQPIHYKFFTLIILLYYKVTYDKCTVLAIIKTGHVK